MTIKDKILIIDEVHHKLVEVLSKNFETVDYCQYITYANFIDIIPHYQGLIIRSKFIIDATVLSIATNLKWIGRYGAGMENIDSALANKKKIYCFNTPEGNRNAVAEHCLGMLLNLQNKIMPSNLEVINGIWNRKINWGQELEGKTIGIIGFGNTGKAFAQKLQGFNVNILVYDKYKTIKEHFVKQVEVNTLFLETDILSLHIPLSSETNQLINHQFLQQFKKQIVIINTSRGPIINTQDLYQNLLSQKLSGACLDVIEYEEQSFENISSFPQVFRDLLVLPQVIFTPHIAGWSEQSFYKMGQVMLEKVMTIYKR